VALDGFNSRSIPAWRPKSKKESHFDEKPPPGVELAPIGVATPANGIPNAFFSFSSNPLGLAKEGAAGENIDSSLPTRHARRIYAGGIPAAATEDEVFALFTEVLRQALPPGAYGGNPVLKIYLNSEKNYAFIEFPSIELCTAAMQLDGIKFDHRTGTSTIRVRRPTDYRPEVIPKVGPIPVLDPQVLNAFGATGQASNLVSSGAGGSGGPGSGKIFVGGLPYNLTDDQVIELLTAFGPLKSFNQVRDPGVTEKTKGYGFCEYFSKEIAEAAIEGLNGMPLGDKILTVRFAQQSGNNNAPFAITNSSSSSTTNYLSGYLLANAAYEEPMQQQQQQQMQQPPPPMAYSYGNSMATNSLQNSMPTRVSHSLLSFVSSFPFNFLLFAFLRFYD
jgi:splicing factor U2AF subunit